MKKTMILFLIIISLLASNCNASANLQENTNGSIKVEKVISISNVTDPHFYELAENANMEVKDSRDIVMAGRWGPDGNRLLVNSKHNPLNGVELHALYMVSPDGTGVKEIVSTPNNTKDKSLSISPPDWNPNGNRIGIGLGVFRVKQLDAIANLFTGNLKVIDKNITTINSMRENLMDIKWQGPFKWGSDGLRALILMKDKKSQMEYQLYLVDMDGSILRKLGNKSIDDVSDAFWSNDGEKIAIQGDGIWVVNRNNSNLRQVTQKGSFLEWGKEDERLYYKTGSVSTGYSLYVVNINGTGNRKISEKCYKDDVFSLSPDEEKILFTTFHRSKLYISDSDGGNKRLFLNITKERHIPDQGATWSPTGNKVSYIENGDLYTINTDGTNRSKITSDVGQYKWNPSGDYIAYITVNGSDKRPILVATPEGNKKTRISPGRHEKFLLKDGGWSPDGSRLLFGSIDYGRGLYVAKFEGYKKVMSIYTPTKLNKEKGDEYVLQVKSLSKPVGNVSVSLDGNNIGTTNATGHLTYKINRTGKHQLNAAKEGYQPTSKYVLLQSDNSTQPSDPTANDKKSSDNPRISGFGLVSVFIVLAIASWRRKQ